MCCPFNTCDMHPRVPMETKAGRLLTGCNGSGCNVRIRLQPRLLPTAFTAYCPLFEPMSADRLHSQCLVPSLPACTCWALLPMVCDALLTLALAVNAVASVTVAGKHVRSLAKISCAAACCGMLWHAAACCGMLLPAHVGTCASVGNRTHKQETTCTTLLGRINHFHHLDRLQWVC